MKIDPITGLPIDDGASIGEERAQSYDLSGLAALYGIDDRPAAAVTPQPPPSDSGPATGFQLSEQGLDGGLRPDSADRLSGSFGFGQSQSGFDEEKSVQVDKYVSRSGNRIASPLLKQSDELATREQALADQSAGALDSATRALGDVRQGEAEGQAQVYSDNEQRIKDTNKAIENAHIAGSKAKHEARGRVEAATAEYRAMLASFDTTLNYSKGQEVGMGVALFFDGFLKARYGVDMDVRGTIREYTDRFIQQQRQRIEGQQQVTALEQWQYQVAGELAQDEVEHAELQKVFALEQLDWGLKMNALAWGGRKAAAETELARAQVMAERNSVVADISRRWGERTTQITFQAESAAAERARIAVQREQLNFQKAQYADQQKEKAQAKLDALLGTDGKITLRDLDSNNVFKVERLPGEKQEDYLKRAAPLVADYDNHLQRMQASDATLKALMEGGGNVAFATTGVAANWMTQALGAIGMASPEAEAAAKAAAARIVNSELRTQSGAVINKDEALRMAMAMFGGQLGTIKGGQDPVKHFAGWMQAQDDAFVAKHANVLLDYNTGSTPTRATIAARRENANATAVTAENSGVKSDSQVAQDRAAALRLEEKKKGDSWFGRGLTQTSAVTELNRNPADDKAVIELHKALGPEGAAAATSSTGMDVNPRVAEYVAIAARAALTAPGKDGANPDMDTWNSTFKLVGNDGMSRDDNAVLLKLKDLVDDATGAGARSKEARDAAKDKLAGLAKELTTATSAYLGGAAVPPGFPGATPPSIPAPAPTPAPGPVSEPQPEPTPPQSPSPGQRRATGGYRRM